MMQEENNQIQNDQTNPEQLAKKPKRKRTRKTIDQELAELEARRQKLLENKRKTETQEKILFGEIVIDMLREMQKEDDKNGKSICDLINNFAQKKHKKEYGKIQKVIKNLIEIKPV